MPNDLLWPVAGTLIALLGLLVAEYRESLAGRWAFKPLASAGFIATGLVAGALDSAYGLLILSGLVLSMLGDILLIPQARTAFLAGLTAFLLGHIAYAGAFWVHGVAAWAVVVSAALLVALCLWLGQRYLPRISTSRARKP